MLKRFTSIFLLSIILINTSFASLSFEQTTNINKQIILEATKIKKIKNWSNYIKSIDSFVNKIDDRATLILIKWRVDDKLFWTRWDVYTIYNYINLKIEQKLQKIDDTRINNLVNDVSNSWLSEEEIQKVNKQIIKLQLQLLDNSKNFVDKIMKDFKTDSNFTETWSLDFKLDIDQSEVGQEILWKIKASFKIDNYNYTKSGFDSQFKSKLSLLIDSSFKWQKEFNVELNTFIDYITKDANMYLLFKELKIEWFEKSTINTYATKLRELALNNEYLKIEDENSTQTLNMISNINVWKIYDDWKISLSKALFVPYKKVWDKYLLVPSKQLCDEYARFRSKIYSYTNLNCSYSDYNSLIKKFAKSWNLYITLWDKINTIWYEIHTKNTTWLVTIDFSEQKIEKIEIVLEPISELYLGDKFNLLFINWQKLDVIFDAKIDNTNLTFKSLLNSNNSFKEINYSWYIDNIMKSNFKLKDDAFNWDLFISDFLLELWEIKLNFNWTIKDNYLNTLDLNNSFIDNNFVATQKLTLKDTIITWSVIIKEWEQEMFNIHSTWKYYKKYFELNNNLTSYYEQRKKTDAPITWNFIIKLVWDIKTNFNADIYFDFYWIKASLLSGYNRTLNANIKIDTPKKFKTSTEVFQKKDNSSYDDFFIEN